MRDSKRKPTYPGEVLREDVLPALKMTQGELAIHREKAREDRLLCAFYIAERYRCEI